MAQQQRWQPLTNWVSRRLINSDYITSLVDSRVMATQKNAQFVFAGEISSPLSTVPSFYDYSASELVKYQMMNYVVYRNVMLIARTVAVGELKVEQMDSETEGGWLEVQNHPFEQIIEHRPNPYMGQMAVWEAQIAWLLLTGEAYWLLVNNAQGELVQMYPLPADRMRPIPDSKNYIKGYAYYPRSFDEKPEFIPREKICYHHLFNPFDFHRGLAPLTAFLMSLKINQAAQGTKLEDYTNNLTLNHIISAAPETTDGDMEQLYSDLEDAKRRADRYMLIRGGDLSISAIQKQVEDDPTAIFSLTESQINSVFGVPDGYWNENSNFASTEQHHASFLEHTIWPLMVRISEDLSVQVVTPYYGNEYQAVFDDPRPENEELEIKEREDARKDQTYGEARLEAGLPLHPDDRVNDAPHAVAGDVYRLLLENELSAWDIPTEPAPNPLVEIPLPLPDTPMNGNGNTPAPDDMPAPTMEGMAYNAKKKPIATATAATMEMVKAEFVITADMPPEVREYQDRLNALIAQAENGEISETQFKRAMEALIAAILLALFLYGAGAKSLDEIDDADAKAELDQNIQLANDSIPALWIDARDGKFKERDGNAPQMDRESRVTKWLGFAAGMIALGMLWLKGDPFLEWRYGPTEHCADCLRLNGQIHRASEWRQSGYRPQGSNLECGGFHCQCELVSAKGPSKGEF